MNARGSESKLFRARVGNPALDCASSHGAEGLMNNLQQQFQASLKAAESRREDRPGPFVPGNRLPAMAPLLSAFTSECQFVHL